MKTLFVLSSLLLISEFGLRAQTTNAAPAPVLPGTSAAAVSVPKRINFHPPDDDGGGILPNRVGGGSRGGPDNAPMVEVLVPEHLAYTTEARPLLYWYQSKASTVTLEVSVTEPKNPKPLMLLQTSKPTSAGVHDFRITADLKPSVRYRWSVAVVLDPQNRSQDVVAYGVIKRIEPSPDLAAKLAQAADPDKPALYAQDGIWYDALESLSTQIKKSPNDDALKQERASLMGQVGLGNTRFDATPTN
jgi:hypothetical protein